MAFMKWDATYQLDITTIDDQHKRLFEMIDHFYEALRRRETKAAMAAILHGLTEYSVYHFHSEESLMQLHLYPAYQEHHGAHEAFIAKVQDFQMRFEQGQLIVPLEVANFLKDWLSKHILVTDKKLAPFLQRKGVH